MRITLRDGLPFVAVVLYVNNQAVSIDDVLLDTGAAASVFKTSYLLTFGVIPTPTDRTRFMTGIGGREAVVEKQIERITVDNLMVRPFTIQLGSMDYGMAMNGILGMDFLLAAGATVDLRHLTLS